MELSVCLSLVHPSSLALQGWTSTGDRGPRILTWGCSQLHHRLVSRQLLLSTSPFCLLTGTPGAFRILLLNHFKQRATQTESLEFSLPQIFISYCTRLCVQPCLAVCLCCFPLPRRTHPLVPKGSPNHLYFHFVSCQVYKMAECWTSFVS